MKKDYLKPNINTITAELSEMIATSTIKGGIGEVGGTDEDKKNGYADEDDVWAPGGSGQ